MSWIGKVPNQLPSFDGSPGKYRDYRFAVIWQYASVKPENRQFYAPALVDALTAGSGAKEIFRYTAPERFQTAEGFSLYLSILDGHYNYLPETELVEAVDNFIYSADRGKVRPSSAPFSARSSPAWKACLALRCTRRTSRRTARTSRLTRPLCSSIMLTSSSSTTP